MWTISSSLAVTKPFESQKIVTDKPSIDNGEQDKVDSHDEEVLAPTEAPSEASTQAEDEILPEESLVEEAKNTTSIIVENSANTEETDVVLQTEEDIERSLWIKPKKFLQSDMTAYGSINDVLESLMKKITK